MLASSGIGLKLWDLESLLPVKEYPIMGPRSGQLALINNFAVKSDSSQIASVIDTDSINLLNLESQIQLELNDAMETKCCCYDSAGRYLTTGNSSGSIEIYDIKSQALKKKTWKVPNSKSVNCICYSKNDRFIAIGNSNGTINLFNTLTNSMGAKPWMHPKPLSASSPPMVTAIQYSNPSLAAAYDDGSVILWDGSKEQPICTFQSHNAPCTSIILSPLNFILMVSGGLDSIYTMYDTTAKKVIRQMNVSGGITSLDMLKNGYTLAVGTANGQIHMYDLRQNNEPYLLTKAHDTSVYCVKFIDKFIPVAPSLAPNKENLKTTPYLTSTLNNPTDITMKRSNSYNNNTELSNIANSPMYNIYSPESKGQFSSQSTANFSSGGESFILHKKQSGSDRSIPNSVNNTPTSSMENAQFESEATLRLDIKRGPLHKATKSRTNEFFSPLPAHQLQLKSSFGSAQKAELTLPTPAVQPRPTLTTDALKSPSLKTTSPMSSYNKKADAQQTPMVADTSKIGSRTMMDFELEMEVSTKDRLNVQAKADSEHILEAIRDEIEDFRDELMSENFRFKAEMLKEFMQMRVI